MSKTRRLNAILFADIAGYTAMMQRDEALAQRTIKKFQRELNTLVIHNEGRIVNFMGDGCLCVFDSSVKAMECALELQQAFLSKPRIPVRIGLHSGDVYFENENVFGDSVNVASRIESIGVPGSILFSERIYNDIRNHNAFVTKPLGEIAFKNVSRPVKVYALSNTGLSIPDVQKLRGKLQKQRKKGSANIFAYLAIVLVIAFGAIYFFRNELNISYSSISDGPEELTIAVMEFKNNTGTEEFDILSQISADRFINGISQLNISRVISAQTIRDYEKIILGSAMPADRMAALSENFGVNRLIEGQIYNSGKGLLMECTITDPSTKEVIAATPSVQFQAEDPMAGIEEMRNHILSILMVDEDRRLNLLLETTPPKYEAYKALLRAKENEDDAIMLEYLNEAIALDSTYFEPKVLRIAGYYNQEEFETADSLTALLEDERIEDPRQKNLLNFYKALMAGHNNLVYKHFNEELELAPYDMMSNNSTMVLAIEFINDVQRAFDIYDIIDESNMDFANCDRCRTRIYIKMYMDLEIGDNKNALRLGKILTDNGSKSLAERLRIRAWVREKMWDELNQYIEDQQFGDNTDQGSLFLYAAKESALINNENRFDQYREAALTFANEAESNFRKGEIFLMNKQYQNAIDAFTTYLETHNDDIQTLCLIATTNYLNQNVSKGDELLEKVEQMRAPYQFGDIDYYLATAYGLLGKKDLAMKHLRSAIAQGQRIGFYGFHNDYWLLPLRSDPKFEEVLDYWKNL